MTGVLRTYERELTTEERGAAIAGGTPLEPMDVVDSQGRTVDLAPLSALLEVYREHYGALSNDDERLAADAWLGPRMHYALRLTRRQAADKGMWLWLAVENHDIVSARWDHAMQDYRWYGPPYLQQFMRLWWGAEIFRTSGDYSPAVRALSRSATVERGLRRKIVRNRETAHAFVDYLVPMDAAARSSQDQYKLEQAINVLAAGTSPEAGVRPLAEDRVAYDEWRRTPVPTITDWDHLPPAPGERAAASMNAIVNARHLMDHYAEHKDDYDGYSRRTRTED